jgi:phospholipid/cholesterol/gamma-HCH transport system substrate-binding protein
MRMRTPAVIALLLVIAVLGSACTALGLGSSCSGTELIAKFEQVGDLVVGANVQSSDVEIGSIQDLELDGWTARVSMCVDEGEQIPADVEAVVRTTSLLGEKFVDLRPQSDGPPFLEDGDAIGLDQTSKATELEEVFAKLASVLGTGNLEQINRFTTAQASILRDNADELREVLSRFRDFSDVLAARKDQIASSVDSLDSVAQTVLQDSDVLRRFLQSFAQSSTVLNDQREGLEDLLIALDEFSTISVQLLEQTESGLNSQFEDLRPVLRTAVTNSGNVRETLQTLATFTEWFPESMPGDYLQLDVCQAPPDHYSQGRSCPGAERSNTSTAAPGTGGPAASTPSNRPGSNVIEFILRAPLAGSN